MLMPLVATGTQVGVVGVLIIGGILISQEVLSPPELTAFFLYLIYVITPLVTVVSSMGELKEAGVSKQRLVELHQGLPNPILYPGLTISVSSTPVACSA